MKRILFITVVAALGSCSKHNDNGNNSANSTDKDFTMRATMAHTAEISAGQMATSLGTANIKSFGQTMVNEHSSARTDLHNIAAALKLYSPDSLDTDNVQLATQLLGLSGRPFDSVYVHSQVTAHIQTIALFQNEINHGMNSRLKDYAIKQIPHLESHLQSAQTLAAGY
jgi:putative membrane protein